VQPGHIFPLAAEPGGVLTRAGHTEAAVDYARIAGLTPAAVIADVLDDGANWPTARRWRPLPGARPQGRHRRRPDPLPHGQRAHHRAHARGRAGDALRAFRLTVYRDQTHGGCTSPCCAGDQSRRCRRWCACTCMLTLRDLLGSDVRAASGWSAQRCLRAHRAAGAACWCCWPARETDEQLLHSVDLALGRREPPEPQAAATATTRWAWVRRSCATSVSARSA
jgi:3,4-dihydroxy 2-butanone 4-phosphate synthase/GTP cyclohydrolase II